MTAGSQLGFLQEGMHMSNVSGAYDVTIKSPMGDQKSVFTVNADGDSFTGNVAGALGSMDVEDGKVDGNTLSWKMQLKVPMPNKRSRNWSH